MRSLPDAQRLRKHCHIASTSALRGIDQAEPRMADAYEWTFWVNLMRELFFTAEYSKPTDAYGGSYASVSCGN
jgi:hypothetical protein